LSEMRDGNLTVRAPIYGNDEVSMMSKAINAMADNLCFALDKLEEKVVLSEKALSALEAERRRSEKLLHNILPAAIAERLQGGEETIAEIHPEVTVLFSDIVSFTELAAKLGPNETVHLLSEIFGKFDELVEKHSVEKIKTIGDSYMVVGGVPNRDPLHCQHVADFAIEAGKFIEEYSKELRFPLRMRIGMHTGTVAAGIVGKKRFSYDLWGDVVNVASRYESTSMPDKIHISEAVKVRLDDDYLIVDGGAVDLKGKGLAKSYFLMGKKSEMPQVTPFRKDSFS
jgi:adenylate cyclase